jgi:hypothetical protein
MVLRLTSCSPRGPGFLAPVTFAGIASRENLAPASGRQDHTPSPSASSAVVYSAISVHRSPPHVRDDRETPLRRGGMICFYSCFYLEVKLNSEIQKLKVRWPWACIKAKYVWRADWTGRTALIRFKKLAFARMRLEAPPILISQAGLLMSIDRGRPEVSAIRSKRRDQPIGACCPNFPVEALT